MNMEIKNNVKLSELTTFRLGGCCKGFIDCKDALEIKEAVKFFIEKNETFIIIGWGSNILASDQGVDSYIIRFLSYKPLITKKDNDLIVSASTKLDDLALYCAENGLEGLSFTSGIPGSVGGAVVGNAGAFGRQIGDIISSVTVIDGNGTERVFFPSELEFTYRNSILKTLRSVVLSVTFNLKQADREFLLKERSNILSSRKDKHPDTRVMPCAGSFFRNIEPSASDKNQERKSAGWFLDQCGAKTLRCGGASVYGKHANIIVKANDECTSKDVLDLSIKMQSLVKEKFNIDLIREVVLLGEFNR